MSNMFWIASEMSNLLMGLIASLSPLVLKLDAFQFDGVVKSGNSGSLEMAFARSFLGAF